MTMDSLSLGTGRLLALTTCALFLGACKQSTAPDWSTFQGNREHTGFVAQTVTPANFSLRWSLDFIDQHAPLQVAANGTQVFLSRNRQLYSIDNFDGSVLWSKDFSSRDSLNAPALGGGKVYVQTGGHENSFLWAYDAKTGNFAFQSAYGNQWSTYFAPAIDKGTAFIAGGYYGGAYAFDGNDGTQQWFFNDNQYDEFTPAVTDQYAIVHSGENNPHLVAIDRETGQAAVTIPDPNFNWNGWSMTNVPVVGSSNNVLAIQSGRLINFNLTGGNIAWELNGGFTGQPSLANGIIYVIANNKLEARRESNGQLAWAWSAEAGGVSGTIVVMNNLLFVKRNNETHAIDLNTHQSIWSYPLTGEMSVQDGTLYISATQKLVAIDLLGDTDGDGIPSFWEKRYGGNIDPTSDQDADGLTAVEEYRQKTNPKTSDTDKDGLLDGDEVNMHRTNPVKMDSDGDSLNDAREINELGTNPLRADSDDDFIGDDVELDAELNPLDASDADADQDHDGFSNKIEIFSGTAINNVTDFPVLQWAMQQGNARHNGYVPFELDATRFAPAWSYTAPATLNEAVGIDGKIFISSDSYFGNQFLRALNSATGSELWNYAFTSSRFGSVHSISGPSVGNGLVYVHSGGHEDTALQAFNPNTGEQVFFGTHSAQWPNYAQPTLVGDRAFINGGSYGGMYGMNAITGESLWFQSGVPWEDAWEPAYANGSLFVVTSSGITAFSTITGLPVLTIERSLNPHTLIVGSRNNVLARGSQIESFDAETGESIWSTHLTGQSFTAFAVGNGQVYGISNGTLYAFSETSGEQLWSWRPAQSLTSNLLITASHVFVATNATTYALNVNSHAVEWSVAKAGKLSVSDTGALMIVSGSQLDVYNLGIH